MSVGRVKVRKDHPVDLLSMYTASLLSSSLTDGDDDDGGGGSGSGVDDSARTE